MNKMLEVEEPTVGTSTVVHSPNTGGQSSIEFEGIVPSSTHRSKTTTSFEETKFMASINQLSVSSVNVPECRPAIESEDINRHTFEQWRDLLVDSMALAGITDEVTKFTIFKVKAGPRLLDIYRNAKADEDAPEADLFPFTHALYRLKAYFGSGSDIMLQRRRLALMEQKMDESDLAFVTRVGSAARLCDYGKGKEFEEIVGTIAEHAQSKEVRTMALKLLSRNGTFSDLVDKVREIEAIRLNEKFFSQKHGVKTEAIVAPVSADFPRRPGGTQRYPGRAISQRGYRGNPVASRYPTYQGFSRPEVRSGFNQQRNFFTPQRNRCWRCTSVYHTPAKCHAINKDCRNCGRIGHIQVACPLVSTDIPKPSAPVQEPDEGSSRETIAAIEKREDEKTEVVVFRPSASAANNIMPVCFGLSGLSCQFFPAQHKVSMHPGYRPAHQGKESSRKI
nr:uncharacterized protein LOC115261683 [Aedes albopictus]